MKINSTVNLIVVCVSILAIITISGCGYKNADTKDYPTIGNNTCSTSAFTKDYSTNSNTTGFADQFDYNYNSNEGVYHVKGSITNKGSKKAHNISVMLSFTDRNGSVLHQKSMQIGDINPSEEKLVSYDWASPEEAALDTKVYQDIKQVLPDHNYNSYIEDREINWEDER